MAHNSRSKLQALPSSFEVRRRTVLGFRYDNGMYIGRSERGAFKPRGLMIWGPTDDATIRMATIGMDEQVLQSMDGVPAKFFALGLSFEHLEKLMEEGVEPPAWVDWAEIERGCEVRIMLLHENGGVLGPSNGIRLAMWGTNRTRVEPEREREETPPATPAPANK